MQDVTKKSGPIVLAILDGWGMSASWRGNAILEARPTTFLKLWQDYPHEVLQAFAPIEAAAGRVGSSDIGHASIGTGRLVHSDITDVSLAISSGEFFQAPSLADALSQTLANHGALHLVGLFSSGGIHSHLDHAYGLLEAARRAGLHKVFVHAITDGVDSPEGEAMTALTALEANLAKAKVGQLASVMGRQTAMDRSGHWDQTRLAYRALLGTDGRQANSLSDLKELLETTPERDSDLVPTFFTDERGQSVGPIRPGDTVLFFNARADRMVQLVRAAADPKVLRWFGLVRGERLSGAHVFTMTDYHIDLEMVQPLFRQSQITDSLSRIVSDHGLQQARVANSDRFAHLTYFFNGGRAEPFNGELRTFLPSPKSTSPDAGLTELLVATLDVVRGNKHQLIVVNFDQVDRAAHTGDFLETAQAVRTVDDALAQLVTAVHDVDGTLIVTADHGNAEAIRPDEAGHRHTANGVPFILVQPDLKRTVRFTPETVPLSVIHHERSLADVAPTILELLKIAKPTTMTGTSLLHPLAQSKRHDTPPSLF